MTLDIGKDLRSPQTRSGLRNAWHAVILGELVTIFDEQLEGTVVLYWIDFVGASLYN